MQLEVTRDVVTDLWPLYRAGEASRDSRVLIDAFLAADHSFADRLGRSERSVDLGPALRLSPDAERRLLDEARDRARLKLLLIGGGMILGAAVIFAALGGAMALVFLRS